MSEQTSQPKTRQEFESQLIIKAWQDEAFKQELISNPKAVYEQELGQKAPEGFEIVIVEEKPNQIYLVLPVKPIIEDSEELSDAALEAIAGGWFFVGHGWVAGSGESK